MISGVGSLFVIKRMITSFTLFDTNDHPLAIDVTELEMNRLGHTQARGVAHRQNGTVPDRLNTSEKLLNFLGLRTTGSF